ncbi:MAG: hypothetical protein L0L18_00965 [Acidipropionibacterium jensenii]|nr:hypothetical protein [Acidipropionibacterium jensenii]
MTNIDRAAEVVAREYAAPDLWKSTVDPSVLIAQALAAAAPPLLMPDLPEPTRWKQNEEPEWDACYTTVSPAGYEGRIIVEDSDEKWEASAGDIRALALAMLAAASYAERNQE